MEKLAVGDKVQLLIDGVSHQGMGVGRIDKMVVFVEGALPTRKSRRRSPRSKAIWRTRACLEY